MTPIYSEQDEWAALRVYASHGDPQAFEVLAHRYQAMVYATCRRQRGSTPAPARPTVSRAGFKSGEIEFET